MEAPTAAPPASERVCEYWRDGLCKQGRRCRFLHTEGLGKRRTCRSGRQQQQRGGAAEGKAGGDGSQQQRGGAEGTAGGDGSGDGSTSKPAGECAVRALDDVTQRAQEACVAQPPPLLSTSAVTSQYILVMPASHGGAATWLSVLRMQLDIDTLHRALSSAAPTAEVVAKRAYLEHLSRNIAVMLYSAAPQTYED